MIATYGSLIGVFLFSIIEPTWEYNMKCKIVPGKAIPCSYKIVMWPQIVVFAILMIAVTVFFTCSIMQGKKSEAPDLFYVSKDKLLSPEESHWKYGCYCNGDVRLSLSLSL